MILFSHQFVDQKVQAIICFFFVLIRLPLICSLSYLHISSRAWEIFGSYSTDSMALGKSVGLPQVLLVSKHPQAIYTLCPFHAGCSQVLGHWCLGKSSLSSGRPQPMWRFYYFSSLHAHREAYRRLRSEQRDRKIIEVSRDMKEDSGDMKEIHSHY